MRRVSRECRNSLEQASRTTTLVCFLFLLKAILCISPVGVSTYLDWKEHEGCGEEGKSDGDEDSAHDPRSEHDVSVRVGVGAFSGQRMAGHLQPCVSQKCLCRQKDR